MSENETLLQLNEMLKPLSLLYNTVNLISKDFWQGKL